MGLGDRLRFYRKAKQMTQRALAAQLQMAPEQLNRYEKGRIRPTVATTVRLARALDVPLIDLFDG